MDINGIVNGVVSHAASLGLFETVNTHEPKNAPGSRLTCAVWAERMGPVPAASGLATTTALIVMSVRIYSSALQQPYDFIDPDLMSATDVLMNAYSGAFTLGGAIRDVDLLGEHGTPLAAQAGYLEQDRKIYRVMTITLPMIINDVWGQVP